MTTRQKFEQKGINLNTILILFTVLGGIYTAVFIGGPLLNMPERAQGIEHSMEKVSQNIGTMERTQAVQTDALQRLTKVAEDGQTTRRDVDKLGTEIQEVKRRLDRIEIRQ